MFFLCETVHREMAGLPPTLVAASIPINHAVVTPNRRCSSRTAGAPSQSRATHWLALDRGDHCLPSCISHTSDLISADCYAFRALCDEERAAKDQLAYAPCSYGVDH